MTAELVAVLNGREIGRVRHDKRGRLSFVYAEDWREAREAHPLSLSMPIAAAEHGHAVTEAFLWGLLPDNEAILDRWARRFQVSARNPFALVSHVGEDCAGAVQFVRPERLEACLAAEPEPVEWLDERAVAERLRLLQSDPSAWRAPRDTGQFSLAGAQPKTALLLEDGRWGVPSGRTPTTHILKPPTGAFDGHAENEHFCLALARRLGLPTATSSIRHFEDQIAIVIERYDRRRTDAGILRIHQEDVCQAMGVPPIRKYENQGGPSAPAIIELLRTHSGDREADVSTFLDALAFNWLVAGTDAHAKNYALLIGRAGRVRLAPLYDLASALPYDDMQFQKIKLAMKIGPDYRLRDIGEREWRRLADKVRVDPDELLGRIAGLAARLPDEAASLAGRLASEGLHHDVIGRLRDRLMARGPECRKSLERSA
jgi:serine/threonine-protein kinase HipA